jgi:hypothetical protein
MKKLVLSSFLAAFLLVLAAPALAASFAVHVTNKTPDAWAWVTAYSAYAGNIDGAWCVAPGEKSTRTFSNVIGRLRVEATVKNCAHPVMLDRSLTGAAHASAFYATLEGSSKNYAWMGEAR